MKPIELLAIGIRLVGVYAIILGLSTIPYQYQSFQMFQSASQGESGEEILLLAFVLAQIAFVFIIAFFMIRFPTLIAKKLMPKSDIPGEAVGSSSKELEIALVSVLGIYILTWAVPNFIDNAIRILQGKLNDRPYAFDLDRHIINEIVTAVDVAIGLFLCLRANGLVKLLHKFRRLE